MLKKIISKALLTVAVDKKARKKINDLDRQKRLLKTQSRRKNIEDSGSPPKKSLNEQAHIDTSSDPRKRIPDPTEQTEKSNAPFIPVENVIESANSSSKNPLHFANNSVLNPIIKKNAKIISAAVAIIPIVEINESGIQGFICCV